jgi:adenosine deaminase
MQNWPKVELHVHLDCSLDYDTVREIDPSVTPERYRESFVGPVKCTDLAEYLDCTDAAVKLLQSRRALEIAVRGLFRQWKRDHVVYGELRLAPLLHTSGGLAPGEVVSTVVDAVAACKTDTGIEGGIILCTLRHFTEEQGMETLLLVEMHMGTHVVGFDIASDEAGYPIDAHINAFRYAREKGIPCTAHAGEAMGPESVWETLEHFSPQRIGHGARSMEDPDLVDHLREHRIHLEVCPTSNIQTNVFASYPDHCVDRMYREGLSISISTDARAITDITLSEEYRRVCATFGWTPAHFMKCNMEAIKHAFTTPAVREKVRIRIMEEFTK